MIGMANIMIMMSLHENKYLLFMFYLYICIWIWGKKTYRPFQNNFNWKIIINIHYITQNYTGISKIKHISFCVSDSNHVWTKYEFALYWVWPCKTLQPFLCYENFDLG